MEAGKITIKTGPPVEGDDFYGREKKLHYAWENHISKGVSLLLSAPRRVGKSSFAKKLLKMAEENGWKTLYLDLQGIGTESDFAKLFKEEIQSTKWWNKPGNTFLTLLNGIEFKGVSVDSSVWRDDTYRKIKELIEEAGEMLIVIDELTIFLNHLLKQENGKEKVESFLEWLRKFRQKTGTKARWIFCSSVGIENFASMHQLSIHLNDLHPFPIGAFSEEEAKGFISQLDVGNNVQFTEDHIQHILEKLGWYLPFFIQILVEKIKFLICVEDKPLSNDTIDEAYNLLFAGSHFNTWDERLKDYYELEDNAREILKLCTLPTGKSRKDLLANLSKTQISAGMQSNIGKTETVLAKLLAMLENDGYLAEHDGKYIFRSPLLRDFWHRRYVK